MTRRTPWFCESGFLARGGFGMGTRGGQDGLAWSTGPRWTLGFGLTWIACMICSARTRGTSTSCREGSRLDRDGSSMQPAQHHIRSAISLFVRFVTISSATGRRPFCSPRQLEAVTSSSTHHPFIQSSILAVINSFISGLWSMDGLSPDRLLHA